MDSLKVAFIALILTAVLFAGFTYFESTPQAQPGKVVTVPQTELVNATEFKPILPVRESKIVVPLAAVNGADSGEVVSVEITRIRNGKGKVLVDVSGAVIAAGTQESLVNAANAAGDLDPTTRLNRLGSDLVFSFNAKGVREVSGGSAGAAIAVGVALLLNDAGFDGKTLVTGALYSNGTVKQVGGVYEKVKAAKASGFTRVLVPLGQSIQSVSFVNETQDCRPSLTNAGEVCTVHRQAQSRDVNLSEEFGIDVREVSSLAQIYAILKS